MSPMTCCGLLALHQIADERAGEDRIFAQIFKGAAVARFARDVRAAAERHVVALRAQFFADEAPYEQAASGSQLAAAPMLAGSAVE